MQYMTVHSKLNKLVYVTTILSIIVISFIYYAPCNYLYFNPDHAIHVLMAKNFELPRDYFYWGQNRLGSLLPMLAFFIGKAIHIHYLYLTSIVQYLFLLTGFLVLSTQITSRILKAALCALLFLPLNQYNALILIGHPYSSQLIAGVLFVFSLSLLRKLLLSSDLNKTKDICLAVFLSFASGLFFTIGIWVSEFNAVLILIPVYFVLFDNRLKHTLIKGIRNPSFIFVLLSFISFFLLGYKFFTHIKSLTYYDAEYDVFFVDKEGLKKNIHFFIDKLKISLLYKDQSYLENSFNWFLVLITSLAIFNRLLKPKSKTSQKNVIVYVLFIISFISSVLLFLSSWNLRSEFSPRYFTPVYIMFCFALLLVFDDAKYKKGLRTIIGTSIVLFCMGFCYITFKGKNRLSPFDEYGEFAKLPKGTLIADYWEAYLINAVATDNLQSLPFDNLQVRNYDWRHIPLSEKNIYFLKSDEMPNDTIRQFDMLFKYSGKSYTCNQFEVLLYHKL